MLTGLHRLIVYLNARARTVIADEHGQGMGFVVLVAAINMAVVLYLAFIVGRPHDYLPGIR
jgi:hypothetical protein